MRPAWRLAISSLWAERRPRARPVLLVAAVALSTALIAAVACAMGSANAAVRIQLESQLGRSDLLLAPVSRGAPLPDEALGIVRSWPEVRRAVPIIENALSLRFETRTLQPAADGFAPGAVALAANAVARGASADNLPDNVPPLIAGRLPRAQGEVVVSAILAERLTPAFQETNQGGIAGAAAARGDVSYLGRPAVLPDRADTPEQAARANADVGPRPGDTLHAVRFLRQPVPLTVVGVAESPPLGGRPVLYALPETVAAAAGVPAAPTAVEISLHDPAAAESVAARRQPELAEAVDLPLSLRVSARIAAGVERNLASSRLGFFLTATMAFLSAAFIITTGMNTGLAEQQRDLAVLRCIGARRAQLAETQLLYGAAVGSLGAALGVPLGLGIAAATLALFRPDSPVGLQAPPLLLTFAGVGAFVCGLGGAAFPAWRAARTSPLRALTQRAQPARPRGLAVAAGVGAALVLAQLALANATDDGQFTFWSYALFGVEAMFVGWFLLCVPAVVVLSRLLAPPLSRLLALPPGLLHRTIAATPYRHGFTAGALMAGVALMIAVWTNGGAFLRDWLHRMEFPDAFVQGIALTPEARERLDALPFVRATSAVSLYPLVPDAEAGFGVRAIQSYATNFIAFEPRSFLAMTGMEFIEGDAETALARLDRGGAVLVAREFRNANGLGPGDAIRLTDPATGQAHEFEIAGVVTSPGLEIASKFFTIGETYTDQSLHAVFGTREDLREKFGSEAIQLIQIDLADPGSPNHVPDEQALETIRDELAGTGILEAGSGRLIKERLIDFVGGLLLVFSGVAVVGLLVACFGVANLIIAGIDARRFEFGVLRAVGARRSLLARLVFAEAALLAVTAIAVGTLMGAQAAWTGRLLYREIVGIAMEFHLPARPMLAAWATVLVLTLAAAAPAIARLNRRPVRELLS